MVSALCRNYGHKLDKTVFLPEQFMISSPEKLRKFPGCQEKKKNMEGTGGKKVESTLEEGVEGIDDKVLLLLVLCGDTHDSGTCPGRGKAHPSRSSHAMRREGFRFRQSSELSSWYNHPHSLRAPLEWIKDESGKGIPLPFFLACEEPDTGTNA